MPTYKNLSPVDAAHLQVCEECGAVVSDMGQHDWWHPQATRYAGPAPVSRFALSDPPVFGTANELLEEQS